MMEFEIIIFYISPWSMVDETTGERREGISINYYLSAELQPEEDNGVRGMRVAKCSVPLSFNDKLEKAPALYKAKMKFTVDSKGKTVQEIKDLEYISEIKVVKVKEEKPQVK